MEDEAIKGRLMAQRQVIAWLVRRAGAQAMVEALARDAAAAGAVEEDPALLTRMVHCHFEMEKLLELVRRPPEAEPGSDPERPTA
jgi:hypothetical protein